LPFRIEIEWVTSIGWARSAASDNPETADPTAQTRMKENAERIWRSDILVSSAV
jgi:hypothetical protein